MAILTEAPSQHFALKASPYQKTPNVEAITLPTAIVPKPAGKHALFKDESAVFGDWRNDLLRDGYVVVKGAIFLIHSTSEGDAFVDRQVSTNRDDLTADSIPDQSCPPRHRVWRRYDVVP